MLKLATKFAPDEISIRQAQDAGFRYAELWLDAAVAADWRNVVERTKRFELEYTLHFPNRLNLSEESLGHIVELYRALNCRCMVIHEPMYDKFGQMLDRLEPGIRLGVENHKLDPTGFQAWAENSTGLTLDIEHVWKFTLQDGPLSALLATLRQLLDRYASKVRHVHLPGYLPGYDEHRPMYCARDMIFPVFSLLADAGVDGFIVSEIDQAYQKPNDLRMDVLLYETWREQHRSTAG